MRLRGFQIVGLFTLGLSLVACSSLNGFDRLTAGEPKIDDSVWFRIKDRTQSNNDSRPNYLPGICPTNTPGQAVITEANLIIECTSQMKIVIDRRFDEWMDTLASWTNDSNAVLDVTVIGAGLAGSLAGGLTSKIMNAVSSGLTGTKKAFNEDVLLTKSIEIIITQMKSNRAQWATIIANRLDATRKPLENTSPNKEATTTTKQSMTSETVKSKTLNSKTRTTFSSMTKGNSTPASNTTTTPSAKRYSTLSEAWDDLQTYSRQGAFNEALATLQINVGAQSAACQAAKVNQKQGTPQQATDTNTGTDSTTGSAPGAATATSPCPTTTSTTVDSAAAVNKAAANASTK